jgi:aryl-alcohol dehydrogenase-like predicted oxidoreductase
MQYKLLGRTGLRVSELCLGSMTFGNARGWGASDEESRRVFDAFEAAGGNFIDTAPGYQNGASEALLGKFIAGARDRYVIATKFSLGGSTTDPNTVGNGRKNMMRMVHESLRRLETDYIDLYWMHAWDGITPEEEVVRGLDDLVRAGKILHFGFSDTPAWVISRSQAIAELRGWSTLAAVQLRYNLIDRSPDRDSLPMAAALGLSVLVWGCLGSGLLSAKYQMSGSGIGGEGRLAGPDYRNTPVSQTTADLVREVAAMAAELGISAAQLALSWVKSRSSILVPIVGARTQTQLTENLGCLQIHLGTEQLNRLNELSAVSGGFPVEFLQSPMMDKLLFGDLRSRIEARSRLVI